MQFTPLLSEGYRVIAPDARGFGKSTYPGENTNIANMAADISTLLEHLGVSQAHIVGISMGGTLALQLTLDHPELVAKLALVNTFAQLRPDRLSGWLYFAWRFILIHTLGLPIQARTVAGRIFPRPDQADLRQMTYEQIIQADPDGYRSAMRALGLFNVRNRLSEIQRPTIIITGECDRTVPLKNQQALAAGIAGARQVIIPQAGHAVTVDAPDQFNQALIGFLANG
jgi:pimeloyl-ACP methyl ester carboxylesterase